MGTKDAPFVFSLGSLAFTFVGVVAACGSPSTSESEPFRFTDAKGRSCTHLKYGLVATCDKTPTPVRACEAGNHACFVVYAGRIEREGAPPTASTAVWNCDACCNDANTSWTGVSTDCSPYACKTAADCVAVDGTCNAGQCQRAL
jgi:hypothetical protein